MDCPVDRGALRRAELDSGLPAFECSRCDGRWVRFGDFLGWRERQPGEVPETPSHDSVAVTPEPSPTGPRRCADCGHLLTRYRVGHGVAFALDQCGRCNGVWLDAGEWEALRGRGLHDNLHQVFGPGWQHGVRTEEQRRATEAQFERQLAAPDFARTREFGAWLAEHPRRSEVLAYLTWMTR